MSKRYVIIGAGIAGISAAEAIREVDASGRIDLFTRETLLPYSRPMISKSPFATYDPAHWTIHDEDWFEENRIGLHLGSDVKGVDTGERTVTTAGGVYPWDRLILATGADPFVPPFPGRDKKNVFTIRRAEDIFEIKKAALPGSKAVIIGGGIIGIEAAVELLRYGVEVTVLEAMPYLMTRQIDHASSDRVIEMLKGAVDIYTGVNIAELGGGEAVECVRLEDGRVFPCSQVIVATGLRADTAIAKEIGAEVQRAIVIDDHCRTSLPDVYAAGDCAEEEGTNYMLWSQGIVQGTAAGHNAAGLDETMGRVDSTLMINSPFMSLFALGDTGKDPARTYEIKTLQSDPEDRRFSVNPKQGVFFERQYLCGGRLVGDVIVGNLSAMNDRKRQILGEV